jgi:putative restriction endonuclease
MKGWIAITTQNRATAAYHSSIGYTFSELTPHHRHIAVNDIFFLRDKDTLVAIAKVQRVEAHPIDKHVQRCPVCGESQLGFRVSRATGYRCLNGHSFTDPVMAVQAGTEYRAHFGLDFVDVSAPIEASDLRPFELTNSRQLTIRPCNVAGLMRYVARRDRHAADVLKTWLAERSLTLADDDADVTDAADVLDEREHRHYGIRLRRGRKVLRSELIRRYGLRCMISGCEVGALLEAACIPPHSAPKFNNPTNALLLRSDLHTLFDLNLIAVDPERLVAAVHPDLTDAYYRQFHGTPLLLGGGRGPNRRALLVRWKSYQANLRDALAHGVENFADRLDLIENEAPAMAANESTMT